MLMHFGYVHTFWDG